MQPARCCGSGALKQRVEEEARKKDSLLSAASSAELPQETGGCPRACLCPPKPQLLPPSSLVMQHPGMWERAFRKCLSASGYFWQLYLPGQPQESEPKIHLTPGRLSLAGWVREPSWADSFLQIGSSEPTMLVSALISLSNGRSTTPALPHLLISSCVCIHILIYMFVFLFLFSMDINARHLTTVGNPFWFIWRPGSIRPPLLFLLLYYWLWVVSSESILYLSLHLQQPILVAVSLIIPYPLLLSSGLHPPLPKPLCWSSHLICCPQAFPIAIHPLSWY